MLYHYLASDSNGRMVEGDLDADNVPQVLQHLAGKELRPISVIEVRKLGKVFQNLFSNINITDKVFLTKYLSLMLRVGTDLLSAINILIADFDKPAMRSFLLEVRDNLSRGLPFYEAFSKYPNVFSPVFVNLVKAAEASGNLQQTFEDLSNSIEQEVELSNKVRSALIYPLILLVAALSVITFLVVFAIPRIAKVFGDSGINPPLFSRIVFSIGLFLNDHLGLIAILFVGTSLPGIYFFWKHPTGRRLRDRILRTLPLISTVYRETAVQRFAATFSALMKAGIPIIQSIRITADVVGSEEFKISLLRVADEGLSKGLTIGEAFRKENTFPRVVSNLIAISEKAGHLAEVLETLAKFYSSNVDAKVRSLVSVIEPLLLMVMGLIVGLIALSIIIPIYQLTSNF